MAQVIESQDSTSVPKLYRDLDHERRLPTVVSTPARYTALSPSPVFVEPPKASKDDNFLVKPPPLTPKRPHLPRGLSLQLPKQDTSSTSTANLTSNLMNRVPLSPKLDSATSFATAASVLPRRSRGMDFSRACTNLHHSTLAELPSPDSSPVIGGRGVSIPRRQGSGPGSPMLASSLWSTMGGTERGGISGSVGSVNMMESTSDSSDSDEDMLRGGEEDDMIHMTPQPYRTSLGPFNMASAPSPSIEALASMSPAASNLMSFRRRRKSGRMTRKSSSSTSLHSSSQSPGPSSPPLLKSVETGSGGSQMSKEMQRKGIVSRRESLSLGTNQLRISDAGENTEPEGLGRDSHDPLGLPWSNTHSDEKRSVIKRVVTRRSNLMPKPKTFARIRAVLQEECSPVDTECRREAEVIRQVREGENGPEHGAPVPQPLATTTSAFIPTNSGRSDTFEDLADTIPGHSTSSTEQQSVVSFSQQALTNSNGTQFWDHFDERTRTPPPPHQFPRGSSSVSEDTAGETPASSLASATHPPASHGVPVRASTPQPSPAVDAARKALGKRRRDDDLDPSMFKRRAVSPGVSVQNSPVLPQSPAQRDSGLWQSRNSREPSGGQSAVERVSSGGSNNGSSTIGKRVGLQGMNDTNDGLMNMTIE